MKYDCVDAVADDGLCVGCGSCVSVCPSDAVTLVDVFDEGLRPVIDPAKCVKCARCVRVCPGVGLKRMGPVELTTQKSSREWGSILEVWEGRAVDPEIRLNGASGGVVTAMGLYCLEREEAAGVLHIGGSAERPLENVSVLSKSRAELLGCCGSRYSPAAACERLDLIGRAEGPCVFIGKPCDVAGVRKSQCIDGAVGKNVNLAISLFCAGTSGSAGVAALLAAMEIEPDDVERIDYREGGWPGSTTVRLKGGNGDVRRMSYARAWSEMISPHIRFRCRLCPDATGEFADIACGDPWYKLDSGGEQQQGDTLVLVRTPRGREVLAACERAGYIELQRSTLQALVESQAPLLHKRREIFGRLLALRCAGRAVPQFDQFGLRESFGELGALDKVRSFLGTIRLMCA